MRKLKQGLLHAGRFLWIALAVPMVGMVTILSFLSSFIILPFVAIAFGLMFLAERMEAKIEEIKKQEPIQAWIYQSGKRYRLDEARS